MPTYEYECNVCSHEFELFQKMTDPACDTCPECGKKNVRKKIGAGAGLIFKGSGFYITDYRSEDYKKQAKAEGKSESSSDSSKEEGAKSASSSGKNDASSGKKESSTKSSNSSGSGTKSAK